MREAVGVETVVGRKVVVNEDHIIKIAAMEPHIEEVVNYSATVSFVDEYVCYTEGDIICNSNRVLSCRETLKML
jgi:hypothetical protein